MNSKLRPISLIAAAAIILGFLENTFWGADSGGAKHDIAVGFFLLAVAGALTLVVVGCVTLIQRVTARS